MAKHVREGCSIECNSARIISRQIQHHGYMEIATIGKCMTYKCKRNSEAKITTELPAPKTPPYRGTSSVDKNDELESQEIYFAVNYKKKLKPAIINHTATHKAQMISETDCYTFAEITRQFPNLPLLVLQPIAQPVLGVR